MTVEQVTAKAGGRNHSLSLQARRIEHATHMGRRRNTQPAR